MNKYFHNFGETLAKMEPQIVFNYNKTYLTDDPGAKKVIVQRGQDESNAK